MEWIKQGLGFFYSSPARLLCLFLNDTLKPYLKNEIAQDNLFAELWSGNMNVKYLQLNETFLNQKIGKQPFQIVQAFIQEMQVDIPWRNLRHERAKVTLGDVVFKLRILFEDEENAEDDKKVETHSVMVNPEGKDRKSKRISRVFSVTSARSFSFNSEGEIGEDEESLKCLEELMEDMFHQMHFSVQNFTVILGDISCFPEKNKLPIEQRGNREVFKEIGNNFMQIGKNLMEVSVNSLNILYLLSLVPRNFLQFLMLPKQPLIEDSIQM